MTRAIPFGIITILLLTVSLLAAGGLGAQGSGGPRAPVGPVRKMARVVSAAPSIYKAPPTTAAPS